MSYLAGFLGLLLALAEPGFAYPAKPNVERFLQPEQLIQRISVPNEYGDNKRTNPQIPYEAEPPQPEHGAFVVSHFYRPHEAPDPRNECNAACQRNKQDLQAQENMARYALWMFLITFVMTGVTGFGIYLIAQTLKATREAAKFASDTLVEAKEATKAANAAVAEAEKTTAAAIRQADLQDRAFKRLERPYLFVKIVNESDLANPTKHLTPRIAYTLFNHGKMPAVLRSIYTELIASPRPELRVPIDSSELFYEVIGAGMEKNNPEPAVVKNSEKGQRFNGRVRTTLIFHGLITYEDAMGTIYSDRFCLRKNEGRGFHIDGGTEYNHRKTIDTEDRKKAEE